MHCYLCKQTMQCLYRSPAKIVVVFAQMLVVGKIVALCGLLSKKGRSCLVKYIADAAL